MKRNTEIKIIEQKKIALLSPRQKTFNQLINKIQQKRKDIEAWHSTSTLIHKKYAGQLQPLLQRFNEQRGKWILLLDQAYAQYTFSKNDKLKIAYLIQNVTEELISEFEMEDLKEIYNKYSDSNYDDEVADEVTTLKDMMEIFLGERWNQDVDYQSVDDIMHALGQKMKEKIGGEQLFQEKKRKKPKKSAKTIAKEEKQAEEEQKLSQSIREIFRKLARELHPDREQDAREIDRKTDLMQRANVAYKQKDLLGLLELQLEVEQIDQTEINAITDEKLKHYNKILTEQWADIKREEMRVVGSLFSQYDIPLYAGTTPVETMDFLQSKIAHVENALLEVEDHLQSFREVKNIKAWLKSVRLQRI